MQLCHMFVYLFFFFNDPATTEIYTLSLHDALPISPMLSFPKQGVVLDREVAPPGGRFPTAERGHFALRSESDGDGSRDRKSTRLNSSHVEISYAVFCLKKKKKQQLTSKFSRRLITV